MRAADEIGGGNPSGTFPGKDGQSEAIMAPTFSKSHAPLIAMPAKRLTQSQQVCSIITASVLLLAFVGTAGRAETIPTFSATYAVRYGLLRGEMTLALKADGDSGYVYETALRPRGFVTLFRRGAVEETSLLETRDGRLYPVLYRSADTISRPARETEYRFDTASGRVTGTYKSRVVDEPMRAGGHDRISVQVAVMQALNEGQELAGFPVFDRARWRDFDFEVVPGRTASVPFGDFETIEIRYASSKKNKSWSLHCAAAIGFVPVMIVFREDGDVKSRAELVEYRKLD